MAIETYGRIGNVGIKKSSKSQTKKTYGFAYPIVNGNHHHTGGYFRKESGLNLIRHSLQQLIRTRKGERVMLPDFGTNLDYYLFMPITKQLLLEIKDDILGAVSKYTPNVKVLKLQVFPIDNISVAGGQGIKVILQVQLIDLDNQIIDVPVEIGG